MTMRLNNKKILGSCLEDCVHVAGILNFFQIAEEVGYSTKFLGPATEISEIIKRINQSDAKFIAISYRLTPATGEKYVKKFIDTVKAAGLTDRHYFLGGLPELISRVKKYGLFEAYFQGGETVDDVMPLLRNINLTSELKEKYPLDLVSRIDFKAPYPILRAHFGLPFLKQTLKGISQLAESKVLDVISIAPDQPAQEWLQRPDVLKTKDPGAGGVPIRSRDHLNQIYAESRKGNYPLLRIYSGTQDLVPNGQLFNETLHNAWAAIPIFWYSELDGRGPSKLEDAISEHFEAIQWHATHEIPVEVNDPHQWGLRMAPDHLVVADAYIAAYIAKQLGVKTYIEQCMFNTPSGNSLKMDLARVLAMIEIVEPLIDKDFRVLRETRAGLAYFAPVDEIAKGQLVASTMMQMAVKPHIMHVVSYCEAHHAAKPENIIESCRLLKRVIQDSYKGLPDYSQDPEIQEYKQELLHEAQVLLDTLRNYGQSLGFEQPFLSPEFLGRIVREGILDASQLKGNKAGIGAIKTRIIDGKTLVVNQANIPLTEFERLKEKGLSIPERYQLEYQNITSKNTIQGGQL